MTTHIDIIPAHINTWWPLVIVSVVVGLALAAHARRPVAHWLMRRHARNGDCPYCQAGEHLNCDGTNGAAICLCHCRFRVRPIEVAIPFEPGHGRPDLEMLYQVVHAIDRGDDSMTIRNNVAGYINHRQEDRRL